MSDKLAIFGAGGHTRSLLALLDDTDYAIYGIYDNTYSKVKKEYINDYKVLGTINDFENENKIILSIGDNKIRKSLFDKYENQILNLWEQFFVEELKLVIVVLLELAL